MICRSCKKELYPAGDRYSTQVARVVPVQSCQCGMTVELYHFDGIQGKGWFYPVPERRQKDDRQLSV